jgi:hypothetical protein
MPGNYKTTVVFPFYFQGAKSARVQLEPFVCTRSYGIAIKVILELTSGAGDNKFSYERIAFEDAITQEDILDGFMSSPFIEVMEGFYFGKTEREILVPVCAILLNMYFKDILKLFHIDLEEYVSEVEYKIDPIGFNHKEKINGYSKTSSSNRKSETSPLYKSPTIIEDGDRQDCKEILRSIQKKFKTF